MRVLFVTDEYPPYLRGGAGVYAAEITNHLADKVEFEVAVPAKREGHITAETKIDERINVSEIGFIDVPGLRFPSSGYNIYHKYKDKLSDYDLIHSSSGMGFMLGGNKLETVHHTMRSEMSSLTHRGRESFEGFMNHLFYYRVRDWLEVRSFKKARRFIAMSHATKDSLLDDYRISADNIVITNNGVDVNRFTPGDKKEARETLGLPSDSKILLFVGRIEERKNVDTLVHAMKELDDYYLVVCGTGPMHGWIESLVKDHGMNNVQITGFVSDLDLPHYYNAADLLVHPADVEGFGLTLIESMASGTPVLTQRKSGMKDILEKCGVKEELASTDPVVIADTVKTILSDESLAKRVEQYRKKAIKEFSWEKIAERTYDVYESMI